MSKPGSGPCRFCGRKPDHNKDMPWKFKCFISGKEKDLSENIAIGGDFFVHLQQIHFFASDRDIEEIKEKGSRSKQIDELLDKLKRCDDDKYETFANALEDLKMSTLAKLMRKYFAESEQSVTDSRGMPDNQSINSCPLYGSNIPHSASAETERMTLLERDEPAAKKSKLSEPVGDVSAAESGAKFSDHMDTAANGASTHPIHSSVVFSSPVYERLLELIEPDFGFPNSLYSKTVITLAECDSIIKTPQFSDGRVKMLLDILCGKLKDVERLLDALRDTWQLHVSNYLEYDGDFSVFHSRTNNYKWPLTEHQQRVLSHPKLRCSSVLSDGFLNELVTAGSISLEYRETVATAENRTDRFIQIMRKRSVEDYIALGARMKSALPEAFEIMRNHKALADVRSNSDPQTVEDISELESKVYEIFNTNISGRNNSFWAKLFAKLPTWLQSISFLGPANSISWYFNCTSIDDVERLKEAYERDELKAYLEDIVTRLSGSKNKVSLRVEWSNDDYQSCKDYLNSHLSRLFEPRLFDGMPNEVLEFILFRVVVLLTKVRSSDELSLGGSKFNYVHEMTIVANICHEWWEALKGRLIRHALKLEMSKATSMVMDQSVADSRDMPVDQSTYSCPSEDIFLERLGDIIEPEFEFPDSLRDHGVITSEDHHGIMEERIFHEKIKKLLELLRGKLKDKGVHLALEQTWQSHVSKYIKFEGDPEVFYCEERNDNWPLFDQQQRMLSNPYLKRCLDVSVDLLNELTSVECISEPQREAVAALQGEERTDRFIRILQRRSIADCRKFSRYVKSSQKNVYKVMKRTRVLACLNSEIEPQATFDAAEIERKVVETLAASVRDKSTSPSRSYVNKGLTRARLPSLSFVKPANGIRWFFDCTTVGDVERLKEAYDSGKLKVSLEKYVKNLSKSQCEVHLRVDWCNDDYLNCKQYLDSHVCRIFHLCDERGFMFDVMPSNVLEMTLIKAVVMFVGKVDFSFLKCIVSLKSDIDESSVNNGVKAVINVSKVCHRWWETLTGRWWNAVTGPSRNGRLIRRNLSQMQRTEGLYRPVSKIWKARHKIDRVIEVKFGLLSVLLERHVIQSIQFETVESVIHQETKCENQETEIWSEFDRVKESTKQLLMITKRLSPMEDQQFIEALTQTHQQHVVNWIYKPWFSKPEDVWPLEDDVLDRMMIHYLDLVEIINSQHGLVDDMLACRCISQSHAKYITSASSCKQRNRRLLEVLGRRSQKDFNSALSCLGRRQSTIVPLFRQTAVVAKLIAPSPPSDEETEYQFSHVDKLCSLTDDMLSQLDDNLQLITVDRKSGKWVFYILCLSKDAVTNLAWGVADRDHIAGLVAGIGDAVSSVLSSLYWPVRDYNRCVHVFYAAGGSYKRLYELFDNSCRRQLHLADLAVRRYQADSCALDTVEKCPDEVLEVVLQKAVTLLFKGLRKMTFEADVGSVMILHMVCRRWWTASVNRQLIRRIINAICHPYRRRPRCGAPLDMGDRAEYYSETFGMAILNNMLFVGWRNCGNLHRRNVFLVCNLSSSSVSPIEVPLGKSVRQPKYLVSCNETDRLYIADSKSRCVWHVGVSLAGKSMERLLKLVKFVEVGDFTPIGLSVASKQLLITCESREMSVTVIMLCDVNGKLIHRVYLVHDVIKYYVNLAVQTTRGTFYVCGRRQLSQSQYDDTTKEVAVMEVAYDSRVLRSFSCRVEDKLFNWNLSVDTDGHVYLAYSRAEYVLLLDSELELERVLLDDRSEDYEPKIYCQQAGRLIVHGGYEDKFQVYYIKNRNG